MPFTNKSDLKSAMDDWIARGDISGTADDRVSLAEARLNRELGEVLTEQSLTGTASSREISVSAYSVAQPLNLFLAETGLDEVRLVPKMNGGFEVKATSDRPRFWTYNRAADKLYFDCPLSGAYPFRLVFRQRFSLAADGDTNWLLTSHPDIYLAACIMWGGLYTMDTSRAAAFAATLEEGIPSVKSYISAQNRAVLTVDPALLPSNGWWDFETGE